MAEGCRGNCGRLLTIEQQNSEDKLCERCKEKKHIEDFHKQFDIKEEAKDE